MTISIRAGTCGAAAPRTPKAARKTAREVAALHAPRQGREPLVEGQRQGLEPTIRRLD